MYFTTTYFFSRRTDCRHCWCRHEPRTRLSTLKSVIVVAPVPNSQEERRRVVPPAPPTEGLCKQGSHLPNFSILDTVSRSVIPIYRVPVGMSVSYFSRLLRNCCGRSSTHVCTLLTLKWRRLDPDRTNGSHRHTTQLAPRRRPCLTRARSDTSFRLGVSSSPSCEGTPYSKRTSSCMYGGRASRTVSATASQVISFLGWEAGARTRKARLDTLWWQ